MLPLLATLLIAPPKPPRALYDYLAKKDPSFSYRVVESTTTRTEVKMISQTWHGFKWTHTLLIQRPEKVKYAHVGILFITGDGPKKGDYLMLSLVTQATGMPVAMLFDIPNQPLEGLREDDLIAHTFEQYLQSPDPTLPLLFPMAKSAIRAMDVVQKITAAGVDPITKFVVTGASKRGWTTWMVGASDDPRVKGIAPMVIDNLNLPAQMKHQMDVWGSYSEMIRAYTERGLQAQLPSGRGHDLAVLVDPYSYRRNIRVPTLVIKGSNDPYWAVDALDQYWGGLEEPKWLLTVPNAAHGLNDGVMAVASIGAFAQSIAGDFKMPKQSWTYEDKGTTAELDVKSSQPPSAHLLLWKAESDNLDFRNSTYEVVSSADMKGTGNEDTLTASAPLSSMKNVALFGEVRYAIHGKMFSLSTPTRVFPKRAL